MIPNDSQPYSSFRWSGARRRWAVGAILAAAIIIRALHFLEARSAPYTRFQEGEGTDMEFYHRWAVSLAAGDWLNRQAPHPVDWWHQAIAEAYFKRNPGDLARCQAEAKTEGPAVTPAHVLWVRWFGGKRFDKDPLYPYLVAATYRVFGPDPRWVYVWQTALGAGAILLIYLIAVRCFGDWAGVVAGVIALVCGPELLYETVLLRESAIAFAGLAIVVAAQRSFENPTAGKWFVTGTALGAGLLLKMVLALFGAAIVGLMIQRYWREPRRGLRWAAAMGSGGALVLAPAMARNAVLGVPPLAMSSNAAITWIITNYPGYAPRKGLFIDPEAVAGVMAKTQGTFLRSVWETLRSHPSVGSYLGLLARKFYALCHWREIPDNVMSYYNSRAFSYVLCYVTPVTFSLIGPLGVLGMALALRRRWRLGSLAAIAPLYLLILCHAATLMLFCPLSRFRLPMMMAMIPFAALAPARIIEARLARKEARSQEPGVGR